ncbi:unnamed protein product [Orchesella dallaii]|uniref:Chitin-binding type-2 domain-containing protein n=1 Tax=Orchesella dallaii TaxID=48710 RepID=A0ABP1Q6E0_9HEXA
MGSKPVADPSQQSCQNYLRCVKGTAMKVKCPTPQFYNHTSGGCVDPPDFSCDSGLGPHLKIVQGMECSIPGKVFPAAYSCNHFFLCLNGMWAEMSCPPGAIFNTKTWRCQVPYICDSRNVFKIHPRYRPSPYNNKIEELPLLIANNKKDSHGPYANICTDDRVNQELIPDPYYCQNFLFCHKQPEVPSNKTKGKDSNKGKGKKGPKIVVEKVALQMYSCPPGKLFHVECGDCRRADEVECGSRHRSEEIYGDNPYVEYRPSQKCEKSWELRADNTILFKGVSQPTSTDSENSTDVSDNLTTTERNEESIDGEENVEEQAENPNEGTNSGNGAGINGTLESGDNDMDGDLLLTETDQNEDVVSNAEDDGNSSDSSNQTPSGDGIGLKL